MKFRSILFTMLFLVATLRSAEQKTVLITGGAGFIGSNFACHMYHTHEDYRIVVLDHLGYSANLNNIPTEIRESDRFEFVEGDICDKQVVDSLMKKSDFVVHFAAESDVTRSIVDDEIFCISNVMGTRNLLHHLVKYKDRVERFVHISSSEVYGTCEADVISEDHPLKPMSPYAATKAGAERLVYSYGCTYQAPVVTLRFFNNYGPNQHVEKVVGKLISLALSGHTLPVHGSGEQKRDWIHVFDTARAIDAALHVEDFMTIQNEVINCGTGVATSINTIAERIVDQLGLDRSQICYVSDRPGQVNLHISSTEKARALLHWEPQISFDEGLAMTIDWYQKNRDFWDQALICPDIHKENAALITEKAAL